VAGFHPGKSPVSRRLSRYRLGVVTVLETGDRAYATVIVAAKRSRQISS
jgi:hypothetical protein